MIKICNDWCADHPDCCLYPELNKQWPCPYQFSDELIKEIEDKETEKQAEERMKKMGFTPVEVSSNSIDKLTEAISDLTEGIRVLQITVRNK
ncbi:hypothetical protein ACFLQL_00480 [Verrucomicrobiota bacterium]